MSFKSYDGIRVLLRGCLKLLLAICRILRVAKRIDPTMKVEGGKWDPQIRRHIELAAFMKEEGISKESKILDVGCGPGWLIERLKEEGYYDISGCDWAEPNPCHFDFEKVNLNWDGLKIYESNSFDVVIASDVLEHLENPAYTLRELARIARPAGHVFVTLPSCWNLFERLYFFVTGNSSRYRSERNAEPFGHISMLTANILESLSDRANLRLVKMKGAYAFFFGHFWGENIHHPLVSYNLMYHYVRCDDARW